MAEDGVGMIEELILHGLKQYKSRNFAIYFLYNNMECLESKMLEDLKFGEDL